ncbi:aminoglycoside phosphotransferase family protein [Cohnella sp. AR92]|uniref:aminoglycoside phosphotransferase family protein n=1 Tax=Cohnella sp. AR92 TaxID=648716 RepID=UPI0013154E54|nr:aminoglycoside phosphotransferase family protein [Cohnella sp. AR92]
MAKLPETLASTIKQVHGEKGERWLAGFGELLRYCERRWGLTLLPSDYPLSFNYVAPALLPNGQAAVLKLRVPEDPELPMETEALRRFTGLGGARLLDAEPARGILLLERLEPGRTLKSVRDDEEAARITARLLLSLRLPAPSPGEFAFPTSEMWSLGLQRLRARNGGETGPLPERLVAEAEIRFAELHRTLEEPLLLHGDLHHDNILSSGGEWKAIDPKGIIGEAAYGTVPFLLNNLPEDLTASIALIRRRIEIFSEEMGLNPRRIAEWTFCHRVLSAAWFLEDGAGDLESAIRLAEGLHAIL